MTRLFKVKGEITIRVEAENIAEAELLAVGELDTNGRRVRDPDVTLDALIGIESVGEVAD